MIPAFLTVILWSLSATCSSRAAAAFGGERANRWRLVLAIAMLASALPLIGTLPAGQAAWWLLLSGVVGLGLGDLAMFAAYERIGARLTVLLTQCVAVPASGLLEWLWLGNGLSASEMLCCAGVMLGIVLALAPGVHLASSGRRMWVGVACGLVSALGLATAGVLTRRGYAASADAGVVLQGVDAGIGAAFLRCLGGAGAAFLIAACLPLLARTLRPATALYLRPAKPTGRAAYGWLIATAVLGPTLGVVCFQWALSLERAAIVQATLALTPIAVMPLAWWLEGDRPKPLAWLGAAIAVAAAIANALLRH